MCVCVCARAGACFLKKENNGLPRPHISPPVSRPIVGLQCQWLHMFVTNMEREKKNVFVRKTTDKTLPKKQQQQQQQQQQKTKTPSTVLMITDNKCQLPGVGLHCLFVEGNFWFKALRMFIVTTTCKFYNMLSSGCQSKCFWYITNHQLLSKKGGVVVRSKHVHDSVCLSQGGGGGGGGGLPSSSSSSSCAETSTCMVVCDCLKEKAVVASIIVIITIIIIIIAFALDWSIGLSQELSRYPVPGPPSQVVPSRPLGTGRVTTGILFSLQFYM